MCPGWSLATSTCTHLTSPEGFYQTPTASLCCIKNYDSLSSVCSSPANWTKVGGEHLDWAVFQQVRRLDEDLGVNLLEFWTWKCFEGVECFVVWEWLAHVEAAIVVLIVAAVCWASPAALYRHLREAEEGCCPSLSLARTRPSSQTPLLSVSLPWSWTSARGLSTKGHTDYFHSWLFSFNWILHVMSFCWLGVLSLICSGCQSNSGEDNQTKITWKGG